MKKSKKLIPTIGLETHVELSTKSKMFCGCPADHFGVKPNSQTCPVCLGLPGALPVPQKKAVVWTIMIGLSLNCKIARRSKFDRKHYFYPDLPKGYQISQYDEPLCSGGYMLTSQGRIRITRVHLEEDTGKLLHQKVNGRRMTLVDFNRSGVPLVEVVTEPDIHSAAQAKEIAQKLRDILRHIGVSDCDMEKGSMRLEANVSLTSDPHKLAKYKVEIKNINSFRFLERAIEDEIARQENVLKKGQIPKQETRGWDEKQGKTRSQRYKESAADYRYFPEPDIPPMIFSKQEVEKIRKRIPEMPDIVAGKLISEYGIKKQYLQVLMGEADLLEYAKDSLAEARNRNLDPDLVAGMIVNRKVDIKSTSPKELISSLIEKSKAVIGDETELLALAKRAMQELPKVVADYKAGKTASIAVLIGKVMKFSGGKADAGKVRRLLEKAL